MFYFYSFGLVFFLLGLGEFAILDVVFLSIPLSLFISPLTCILLPLTILDEAIVSFFFVCLASVRVFFFIHIQTKRVSFFFFLSYYLICFLPLWVQGLCSVSREREGSHVVPIRHGRGGSLLSLRTSFSFVFSGLG